MLALITYNNLADSEATSLAFASVSYLTNLTEMYYGHPPASLRFRQDIILAR